MITQTKYIKGFKNYMIHPGGWVYSIKSDKILKPMITRKGYHMVALYIEGKRYYRAIARLVAIAFINNPENKPEVNHKDGDKSNNIEGNLEWVTGRENIHHAFKIGLRKANPKAGRPKVPIYAFDMATGTLLSQHESINHAVREYSVSQGNVCQVLKGIRAQTCGITFKYVNTVTADSGGSTIIN